MRKLMAILAVLCYCSQDTVAYPSSSTDGPAVSGVYNELYFGPY